ncbi:MAG: D-serine ammonia-lyase [Desulfococcaceae bacterium]
MNSQLVAGKTIDEWKKDLPLIERLMSLESVWWRNPLYDRYEAAAPDLPLSAADIADAEARLNRFAPLIARLFPETAENRGIIESPLVEIPRMRQQLERVYGQTIEGRLLAKCDSLLPISGSIKARGGIYEVLKHAESLALEHRRITLEDDYGVLAEGNFRSFFSGYGIAVGSTGNLGLSIGIMGARLGFRVVVHMSADAKQWKKDLLAANGVTVIQYESDYSRAVAAGRKQAEADPRMHFIDDENSTDLFLGYAVAALRLKRQLTEMRIPVDGDHPLLVYLPCGVGGGPGGITFGLKTVFKDHVHCWFAEPVRSPCMLLGLMTQRHDQIRVQEFGIDNRTAADGLAVGTPSGFVGRALNRLISGVYTVPDEELFLLLYLLADSENLAAEPSAAAGLAGPIRLFSEADGRRYPEVHRLRRKMARASHVVWVTGGSMVPSAVMAQDQEEGLKILRKRGNSG